MDETVFISRKTLCARYGVSHMFVERRLKDDPTFPKPTRFGKGTGRRYWRIDEIEKWERARAAAAKQWKITRPRNSAHSRSLMA